MPPSGGKTTNFGINFQAENTVLYLGRLLDPRPYGEHETVIEVRPEAEAEAEVDDILVRYKDGHTEWIQVKVSLAKGDKAWQKCWLHFAAQAQSVQHPDDRIVLLLGRPEPWSNNLREICERAANARNSQEWFGEAQLSEPQRKLVEELTQLLGKAHATELFDLFRTIDVRVREVGRLRSDLGPLWIPESNINWPDLFDKLKAIVLDASEKGKPIDRQWLVTKLASEQVVIHSGALSSQKWDHLLAAYPPPQISQVNPYQVLHLTKGEVGAQYDFEDMDNLPPYIPRDIDTRLDQALAHANGGFIVLVGPSKCGKSRSAFEALRRNYPQRKLIVPDEISEVKEILDNYQELGLATGEAVLWLDNLHSYLNAGLISPGTLQRLITAQGLWVMATMWETELRNLKALDRSAKFTSVERPLAESASMGQMARDVLAHAQLVRVEPASSSAEKSSAQALYSHTSFGPSIAETFVAKPELIERFENGAAELRAVVCSAIDMRRAGVTAAIPLQLLQDLFPPYYRLQSYGARLPEDEIKTYFQAGLDQALEPVGVSQRLLQPDLTGKDTFTAFDPLVYQVEQSPNGEAAPIPAHLWEAALTFKEADLLAVGYAAYLHKESAVSERAWRNDMKLGGVLTASNLGVLLIEQGKIEEAIQAFHTGIQLGDGAAAANLGVLLIEQGKTEEAIQAYRTAIKLGHGGAAFNLGVLLEEQGKTEEAIQAFRTGMALGHGGAAFNLGVLLEEQGKTEEAIQAYCTGIKLGYGDAASNFGLLLEEQGKTEEAIQAYRTGIQLGDGAAAANLGVLLEGQGKTEEAIQAYRTGIELGEGGAAFNLGVLLNGQGKTEEAIQAYSTGIKLGYGGAALNLGLLLNGQGKTEEAIQAWRTGIELGEGSAAYNLGVLLEGQDKTEEAIQAYRTGIELGNGGAAHNLGLLLQTEGRSAEAERAFHTARQLGFKAT